MKRTRFTESQIVASIKNRKAAYLPRMFAVSWVLAMLPFTTGKPNMAAWKPVM
ncbi:MAG: hypothetical protein IPQ27_08765 [Chitinophagaceae bacterium]|nr:hypothetical protein [Chitinophagaceae bacterium]